MRLVYLLNMLSSLNKDIIIIIIIMFQSGRHNSDNMRQTTCQVFNPIMVDGYNALFSCISVVQASDSITADAKL